MLGRCSACSSLPKCLFSALTPKELDQLASFQRELRFNKNAIIYPQGGPAESVYFLCRGTVSLVAVGGNGTKRIAAFIRPGEMFGLDSLLPEQSRLFTAVARECCACVYIHRNEFARVLRLHPPFMWRFVALLNQLLHRSEQRHLLLSGERIRDRLRNALLQCGSIRDVKQVEIAELLGVPSETVSRELKKLRSGTPTQMVLSRSPKTRSA